jgi:hypothetical protein
MKITPLHIVRRSGEGWYLMTAGGNHMPPGRHTFESRDEAWERAVALVYEALPAVSILYDHDGLIEWIVYNTPRDDGYRPDTWIHRPGQRELGRVRRAWQRGVS